ncbi:MAG: single-stranded DNA-binding protein [Candidatus Faecousia sp.]|nr:single-stranded DNA-binding protein [Candidatus Faecousia sp.]
MEYPTNQAHLRGNLLELPVFSHESNGKRFFRFFLEVARLSGAVDTLPVIIQQECLNELDLSGGEMLDVVGQVRSHNLRTSTGRRLLIFVFGQTLTAQDGPAVNEISLCGNLCREPSYRRTPLGREICDVMLAVPRPSRRADYIPCILWGSLAQKAARCHVREQMGLSGRLQSRIYTKLTPEGAQEKTAYEVSALTLSQEM